MMRPSPRFFTPTMARLYADQGYLRKAVQIYRYLVQQEPEREDLQRDLAALEEKVRQQTHPSTKELGLLMRDWADLVQRQQKMKRKG